MYVPLWRNEQRYYKTADLLITFKYELFSCPEVNTSSAVLQWVGKEIFFFVLRSLGLNETDRCRFILSIFFFKFKPIKKQIYRRINN